MRTKRHEDARRDGGVDGKRYDVFAFSSFPVFCGGDLGVVRLSWTAASQRSPQVHTLVVLPVSACGYRHRLGDVSVFALRQSPVIQAILRHSDISTTLSFYVETPEAESREALDKLMGLMK